MEKNDVTHPQRNDSKDDPLSMLNVIERLEIGPVELEPRRVIAPYRVTKNGETHTINLLYRFEEDVFSLEEPASFNLASMLAAQVSLNYGLFCNEMAFHGWFDGYDKRFIEEMAQNTAREIFVKKFLEHNPFLHGSVTQLPLVKLENYLRARITFKEPPPMPGMGFEKGKKALPNWSVKPSWHAVISSGGKDSLLTFGLLREIGVEVHPIFINESGRHWFTALNAYRHFTANIPSTARVWTNADRVFTWMLRHLPFVRRDFERIRSDEYPIRLWTVAVFVFGALPILKKRGIGRLLIGDEFDTTHRVSYRGITHYDGLYDQSRYFDNAMTRYFYHKAWGISQLSILRPLSELLIEKILIERYPDLQQHQVSCHAAHKDGDRVRPCGRCEKCRRIVGILMALGADPAKCGYTLEQINHCLKHLSEKGIHQETEGVKHLGHLLKAKGLITGSKLGSVGATQRPEIMKLRFDSEKSAAEDIPVDLREHLYRLYMEHADGAVKRSGRIWINFDPFSDKALKRPYPFKAPRAVPFRRSKNLTLDGIYQKRY